MKITACTILLLLSLITNAQQPGTLDQSFGDSGVALSTDIRGVINVLALQSDGKVISGGSGGFNDIQPLKITRYNTDGTIDDSFGKNGFTGANELSEVFGMAVQKDDAIIAFGHTGGNIKLARYKKNGRLDSSFGANGTVITDVGKDDIPTDIVIQPDGKIVVGGYIRNAENEAWEAFLVRYLPDGSIDKGFADGGTIVFVPISDPRGLATLDAIALQPDGKIIAATTAQKNYVYRFNTDGSLDKSFGNEGEAYFQGGAANIFYFEVKRIAVQPDGKIVGVGSGFAAGQHTFMAISRLNADGTIDSDFGQNGFQYNQFGTDESEGYAVLLQIDGKIIISGWEHGFFYDHSYFALARFNKDGTIDSSFGTDGKTTTVTEGRVAVSKGAVLQKDGKIVLGGDAGYDLMLVRYNNDDHQKQPVMVRIKRWLQHHGISWQTNPGVRYYSVQRSIDGGITYKEVAKIAGSGKPVYNYEDAAAQVTGNSNNVSYRLAVVAKDGYRTYSNTVLLDESQQAKIFPNPVRGNLQLQGLPQSGKTNLSVLDLNGNVRSSATATGTNYSVNTANLSSGSYLLKIQHGSTATTLPFVKE